MAERLEALKHAAEATEQASAAGATDLQGGPRHLAGTEAADPGSSGTPGYGTMIPLADDLSLPQSPPSGPPTGAPLPPVGQPTGSVLSPAGPPPVSPLTPATPTSPVIPVRPPDRADQPGADGVTGAAAPSAPNGQNGTPGVDAVAGDEEPADGDGSPAAAIADMLRHGSSSLFFNRNLGRP